MEDLLKEITYEGKTPKELEECVNVSRRTLYRQLDKLVEEGLVVNKNGTYKKLRPLPSVGELLDKMMTYHQQKLMDFKYRKLPKDVQSDITLQWVILTPNIIKGESHEYEEQKLEDILVNSYNLFQRQIGG